MASRRRSLRASPPGSTTWIYIADDGSLTVEFYDYGQEAQDVFGNDVAFLLSVNAEHKRPLLERLREPSVGPHHDAAPRSPLFRLWQWLLHGRRKRIDVQLLDELEQRFANYFEVKAWFDAAGVPYSYHFDSWA